MSDPRKFKSDIVVEGDISLPSETASRALIIDSSGEVASSTTTDTELAFLSGVTSSVQDQLDAALGAGSDAQTDIDNHINDTADAHDASAISSVPSGNLAATDVQGALNELQSDVDDRALQSDLETEIERIDDLVSLSGVASNAVDLGTFTGAIIPDSSTVKGALQSLETSIESLPDPMEYKGNYNASTNSPSLADGVGDNGDVYHVNVAGSQDFGSGSISFTIGDKVVYNGVSSEWEKWDLTDSVTSVFGRSGAVTAQSGDYDASEITNTPAGSIAATDVQAAINELDGDVQAAQGDATQALSDAADALAAAQAAQQDIDDHIADTSGAHAASAISVVPAGNLASTDVQSALEELQGDIDGLSLSSLGDINETSFSMANNQASPANVTGLAFSSGVVRSFSALVSVEIDATADLYEQFSLQGINKGGSFGMSVDGVGDSSGIEFSITSGGQVQYTSGNAPGFSSGAIKFRAITTSV